MNNATPTPSGEPKCKCQPLDENGFGFSITCPVHGIDAPAQPLPSEPKQCEQPGCKLPRFHGFRVDHGIDLSHPETLPSSPSEATELEDFFKQIADDYFADPMAADSPMRDLKTEEMAKFFIRNHLADLQALIAHHTQQRADKAYERGVDDTIRKYESGAYGAERVEQRVVEAEQKHLRFMATLLRSLGVRVEITRKAFVETDDTDEVTVWEDPATGNIIYDLKKGQSR